MRVTVAGCWGGSPRPGGACSGYLVQASDTNVLLDCGAGVAGAVQRACPLTAIDHVVVSHFHHDHVSDAGVLMFARLVQRQLGQTDRDLTFYAPGPAAGDAPVSAPAAACAPASSASCAVTPAPSDTSGGTLADAPDTPAPLNTHAAFDLAHLAMPGASHAVAIDEGSRLNIGPLVLDFLRTKHPAPCLATRVTCDEDGAVLVYTADAALTPELATFCTGADALIAECSLYPGYDGQAMGHMSCEDVVRLARQARPGTLVLTHLPIYGDVGELAAYVRARLTPEDVPTVLLASEPTSGCAMLGLDVTPARGSWSA